MNFIEWLKVIVLGIVEGITEWLPISSTGHLILTDAIWPLQQSDAFKEMFNVVIQLGAILAVVVLYWSKLWPFHRKRIPPRSSFAQQSTNGLVGSLQRFGDRSCWMDKNVTWPKTAVSCLPAMLIGLPRNDWLDKHFYNPTVVALMLLLYGAGFLFVERYNRSRKPRVNSIAALRWSDYDAQTQTIHVTKQYLFYNGQGTVSPPKSSTSVRYVSIPEEAAKLLEQEHEKHPKNPYMCPSPVTGEMYHPDAIVKIHRKICKDIGLEYVRFHDLRHSFATTALQCGVDVKTVSTMLGHSSAGFTLNVYTHSTSRMQPDAARTVGNVMPKMLER